MKTDDFSAEYICTHLGEEALLSQQCRAVNPPIYATSLHTFATMEELLHFDKTNPANRYIYSRVENPTVKLVEQKIAALEEAEDALCFASGMAAITSAVMHFVRPDAHLISVRNVYGPARTFFENNLSALGVKHSYVDGINVDEFSSAIQSNTVLFYLESPTSAVMQLQDLEAVAKLAKARGVITIIDNTWATPLYQKPLSIGIDIVIHTLSKYMGGHSDLIGGVLCANRALISQIRLRGRELYGGILSPFEAWLVLRGLRTLPLRLKASSRNAMAVAELLQKSPMVRCVNYPGLDVYPQRLLAQRQMTGSSGLFSFELDGSVEDAIRFANHLRIFQKGISWGGFESLVCMPMYRLKDEEAVLHHASRNLVRLYTGLEDSHSLLEDVQQALQQVKLSV